MFYGKWEKISEVVNVILVVFLQAVKLESLRAGRTRYLVVVSRPAKTKTTLSSSSSLENAQPQLVPLPGASTLSPQMTRSATAGPATTATTKGATTSTTSLESSSTTSSTTSVINTTETTTSHSNTENIYHQCSFNQNNNNNNNSSILSEFSSNNKGINCDKKLENMRKYENTFSDSDYNYNYADKSNANEIEESCLLGIDCNERTTVGLVLKVLNDTSIRLDGDG